MGILAIALCCACAHIPRVMGLATGPCLFLARPVTRKPYGPGPRGTAWRPCPGYTVSVRLFLTFYTYVGGSRKEENVQTFGRVLVRIRHNTKLYAKFVLRFRFSAPGPPLGSRVCKCYLLTKPQTSQDVELARPHASSNPTVYHVYTGWEPSAKVTGPRTSQE